MGKKIRVLIIDDASFMVKALREILEADAEIEVVGSAKNGQVGLDMIKELQPDVVTLDVDMPVMDGLRAVRHIMIESPVPIVMLSSLFSHGDITFDALRLGVVDFLPKPSGAISRDIHTARDQVVDRVKIAASIVVENIHRAKLRKFDARDSLSSSYGYKSLDYMVAVGTTLGGPNTMIRVMSQIPPDCPTAMVVTQEISTKVLPTFVEKFDEFSPWCIRAASDGLVMEQGCCYVCSNDEPYVVSLNENNEPCLQRAEPNGLPINTLMTSVANIFNDHAIGVLLTGIGDDGTDGMQKIKDHGGVTLAQDTDTCVYPNLTQTAIEHGVIDHVVNVSGLADKLESLIAEKNSATS